MYRFINGIFADFKQRWCLLAISPLEFIKTLLINSLKTTHYLTSLWTSIPMSSRKEYFCTAMLKLLNSTRPVMLSVARSRCGADQVIISHSNNYRPEKAKLVTHIIGLGQIVRSFLVFLFLQNIPRTKVELMLKIMSWIK